MFALEFNEKLGQQLENLIADLLPDQALINAYKDGSLVMKHKRTGKVHTIHYYELVIRVLIPELAKKQTDSGPEWRNVCEAKLKNLFNWEIHMKEVLHPIDFCVNEWNSIKHSLPKTKSKLTEPENNESSSNVSVY